MSKTKLLSVIVPAYKQGKTIEEDIRSLVTTLKTLPYNFELIIVVDGFIDNTYKVAKKMHIKGLFVIGYEQNHGKGYAIQYGVSKAKGDIIGFIDAGMDINPTEIAIALDIMEWNKADIVIGSKLHPDSKVKYPLWRHITSWGYRSLLFLLFHLSVRDTQVGLKFFRKKVAKKVFPKILVKKFAFDVEVLAVAISYGYNNIYESPIILNFNGKGSISSRNFWKIIGSMMWDTGAVFYRLKILRYYSRK